MVEINASREILILCLENKPHNSKCFEPMIFNIGLKIIKIYFKLSMKTSAQNQ